MPELHRGNPNTRICSPAFTRSPSFQGQTNKCIIENFLEAMIIYREVSLSQCFNNSIDTPLDIILSVPGPSEFSLVVSL
jgi:hypothetical protein